MANCIICITELKFLNTPTFGSGKLNDNTIVCTSCFKKINKLDPKVAFKLKNYSLETMMELFKKKTENDEVKTSRLDEIKSQIQAINLSNVSSYLGRREISELPAILAQNEVVDNLAQGTYNNGQGILVSTDRRLLFIDKGMLFGLKVEDFPLDKISSIQYETGLIFGSIKIHTTGNVATIENVEKASARSFAEFVRNELSQPKEMITTTIINEPNILDQLEKLAKLKENGILTEEEFNQQKIKLLAKL